jgi:hypothetical protein
MSSFSKVAQCQNKPEAILNNVFGEPFKMPEIESADLTD